ncbi:MAG: hypothetical protein RL199_321 [Pseudomonadota bacterium]|jgi:hypothetical protein
MSHTFTSAWMLGVLVCAFSACTGTSEQRVHLRFITRTCGVDPALDPLSGLNGDARVRVRVYGAGIDTASLTSTQLVSAGTLAVPAIPAGKERRILVEVTDGTAASNVVARGEAGPLDLNETTEALTVDVFLRRVDAFTPVSTAADPGGTCATLAAARAGHTATTLSDGRVLVVGGFNGATTSPTFLKSTEIFDPRTGSFTAGPDMFVARAFHTATRIPGTGLVLVVGGENDVAGKTGGALGRADLFNEATGTFSGVQMRASRTRHAAAAAPDGSLVLVVGGLSRDGFSLDTTEVFNPQTKAFSDGPKLASARGYASAIGLTGRRIVVAGGWAGAPAGTPVATTELFTQAPGASTFTRSDLVTLRSPQGNDDGRIAPALALSGDHTLVVTGGRTLHDGSQSFVSAAGSSNGTYVIDVDARTVRIGSPLIQKRSGSGALTLFDGSAFVGGGAYSVGSNAVSSSTAELFVPASAGTALDVYSSAGTMQLGRHLAAWTLLTDGTVLTTGGLTYENGTATTLATAEVFQPAYQGSNESPYR